MHINDFMICIRAGQIPREAPDGLAVSGYGRFDFDKNKSYWEARDECANKYNMWAIVSCDLACQLAAWIGKRRVLEVMSGAGWLAKALTQYEVDIIATDNYGWKQSNGSSLNKPIHSVRRLRAENAVVKISADVLLVSWPPYSDDTIVEVCKTWGTDRPIIYIGEDEGGCNAPDEFFQHFHKLDDAPSIPLLSWYGIHDRVQIGRWS